MAAPGTPPALEAQCVLLRQPSSTLKRASSLFARQHRYSPTPSEALPWSAINARQLGVSFRRQMLLAGFIADFLAPAIKLVVEVDGAIQARKRSSDARRDLKLHGAGYRVVRISAALVLSNLPTAVAQVRSAL